MINNDELKNKEHYKEFSHSFIDEFLDKEVKISARFRKPNRPEVDRFNQAAVKKVETASNNLLLDIVHAEDKERFTADINEYPGVITTVAGVILKSLGLSAELGK